MGAQIIPIQFFIIDFLLIWLSFISNTPVETAARSQKIAIVGTKIYPSPSAEPILEGIVIIEQGKIVAVGNRDQIMLPEDADIIDGRGRVLTASYWNCHVHFMETKWNSAAAIPAALLEKQLVEMLLRYGFVHVFDLASLDHQNILALKNRINSGEVAGPNIMTVGVPFTPLDGSPYYIAPLKLPEIGSPMEAAAFVEKQISGSADGIKIWSASPNGKQIVYMPSEVIKKTMAVAKDADVPVFAHPTNNEGVMKAVENGVDILTHTSPDDRQPWDQSMIDKMLKADLALIPTLKLFKWELGQENLPSDNHPLLRTAIQQLNAYAGAGGEILFGTDVGYMTEYSPLEEYELMAEGGMGFLQILDALTTKPAARFGLAQTTGKIEVGMDADMVLLTKDPMLEIEAFAEVMYTFRKGEIIYVQNVTKE